MLGNVLRPEAEKVSLRRSFSVMNLNIEISNFLV